MIKALFIEQNDSAGLALDAETLRHGKGRLQSRLRKITGRGIEAAIQSTIRRTSVELVDEQNFGYTPQAPGRSI